MKLFIKIKDQDIKLELIQENQVFDILEWRDERDLLESLLPNIEKLLAKNKLDVKDLEKVDFNRSHFKSA